jgi:hypothetical protein
MSGRGAVSDVLRRAADAEAWERWQAQVRAARFCARPVRLSGRTESIDAETGELTVLFSTEGEPDGVLLKACGCRRESVCENCAAVYRADAFQLVAAGLRGGKGVPPSVAERPAVFATLTAPGFGPVHTARDRGPCRRGRQRERCPHGRPVGCAVRHAEDDERLGEPLCVGCFDYEAAVLWNASVGELWRRTVIYLRRALARTAGVTERARVSYAKVVEYQRRGVVHVHAVIRLDGGEGVGAGALVRAVRKAAARVAVPLAVERDGQAMRARWGPQVDVRPIAAERGLPAGAVAAYVAKYATKSADRLGVLDHRLDVEDLPYLPLRPHLRKLVDTAWTLGGRPELAHLRLRAWAHTLGYRGHWLTKSRAYSTTFGALRAARAEWHGDHDDGPRRKNWRYAGRGYTTRGDAWLAEKAARDHAEARHIARAESQEQARESA